jgi:hypothetical protein
MRGFIITTDGIMGLVFFFLILGLVASYSFKQTTANEVYLKQFSMDFLTVMEKNGRIDALAEGDSTRLREIIDRTPIALCLEISATDSSGTRISTITKEGCGAHGNLLQTTSRPFIYNESHYTATVQSWYRSEPG